MVVFHPPAVDHIRPEGADLFPELFFQFRHIDMGRCLRNRGIAAGFVDNAGTTGAPVQDPDLDPLAAQAAEHMVHPVDAAHLLSGQMGPDHAGGIVAQPQQLHFLTPFLIF